MTVSVNVALPMIIMTTIAIGVFCIILQNQIRDRKVQEEKMQLELEVESKRNLASIINTIAFPVYVLDRDHRFTLVNDSYCRFVGRPREEIEGKTHRDLYNKDDAERHWERVETAFRTYAPREEEVVITRPADGALCTIISTSTMYRDAAGQEFLVGVIEDITERTTMQKALADSEAWYRILFEHTGAATVIINEDTIIDQANSEFENVTGYTRGEVEGKVSWTSLVLPEDLDRILEYHRIRNIDPSASPTTYTVRMVNRQGQIKTLHAVVTLIPGTKKRIASYVDISEQKKSEDALTQVNRKLNLLSSITRHDIINQLLILKGFLTLLRKKTEDPGLLDYVNRSEKATQNIEHQIRFTRDYQDMGVKAPTWQNVRSTIISAKGALSMGDVTVEVDHPDLEILADPLFEKVFYNLIDNTLKYGGDAVRVIRITPREEDTGLVITYEDDGVGITKEDQVHLFERGFGKHTGFGLFLSREMLSITGISIEYSGEAGKGARFTIRVPRGLFRMGRDTSPRV
jgi:PAS domain S-box-containing protein